MINQFFKDNVESLARQYQHAEPFPHTVLENFLDESILESVLDEFPDIFNLPQDQKVIYGGEHEYKAITSGRAMMGKNTNALIDYLNGGKFLNWVSAVTGMEREIIADDKLMGGGLHESRSGGFLKIHADFNKHYETGYDRRINILIYLNKDWKEEWGGGIELWDKDMKECVVKAVPRFNTCVIFNTTSFSYHGHPDPMQCPEDVTRKSIALYYYTKGRPQNEILAERHNSIFKARPELDSFEDIIT